MKLIVCVDNKNGLRFNHRRQSRDSAVCDRIRALTRGGVLRMNADSAKLFAPAVPEWAVISENFLAEAAEGDFCFCEDITVHPYLRQAEQLYLFHWNRTYPADRKLNLTGQQLRLVSTEEFAGSSHEKITLEVFDIVR